MIELIAIGLISYFVLRLLIEWLADNSTKLDMKKETELTKGYKGR